MTASTWRERFEAFGKRRTEAALAASMPPYVTDDEQPADGLMAVGNDWTRARFGGSFYVSVARGAQPACSLVFVQSADGNTGAANPADLGGGTTDAYVIYEGLSRVAADAVLSGAETVRGGGTVFSVWHPELVRVRAALGLPRHPVQMVATLQGLDVDRMLLFNVPELAVIVLTVADAASRMRAALQARPWVTVVEMPGPAGLRHGFDHVWTLGVRRISCIGGRRLAGSLLEAGLIDDVYLTTASRPGGEPNTPLSPAARAGTVVVRKHGTAEETGVVFEHLALTRGGSPLNGRR